MSAKQRHEAEVLRAKYARVHDVPLETVKVTLLEDEDAQVQAPGLPAWTLGRSAPAWVTNHKVRTL